MPYHLEVVRTSQNQNIPYVFFPVSWGWRMLITDGNQSFVDNVGHRTLLIVDTRQRTYHLFDTVDGNMAYYDSPERPSVVVNRHDMLWVAAHHFGPLIEGYTAMSTPRQQHPSLQSVVDRPWNPANPTMQPDHDSHVIADGMCTMLTLLVCLGCALGVRGTPNVMLAVCGFNTPTPGKRESLSLSLRGDVPGCVLPTQFGVSCKGT